MSRKDETYESSVKAMIEVMSEIGAKALFDPKYIGDFSCEYLLGESIIKVDLNKFMYPEGIKENGKETPLSRAIHKALNESYKNHSRLIWAEIDAENVLNALGVDKVSSDGRQMTIGDRIHHVVNFLLDGCDELTKYEFFLKRKNARDGHNEVQ